MPASRNLERSTLFVFENEGCFFVIPLGLNIPCPATGYQSNPSFLFRTASGLRSFIQEVFVIPLGFEPKTHSLEGCCSIQLSYGTILSWTSVLLSGIIQSELFLRDSTTQNNMHRHSPRNLRMQRYAFYSNPANIIPKKISDTTFFLSGVGFFLTQGARKSFC